jgi:RimJ/RimL family protein N-acetyltransferase
MSTNVTFEKMFPETLVLETDVVRLRALEESDTEHFRGISKNKDIWTYFTKDLSDDEELTEWVIEALRDFRAGRRFPFTIIEKSSGRICGCTSFGNISAYDRRIEIGWTWLGDEFIGTGINAHAKFLLLHFAFERLNFIRVEIKTDNKNTRAKKALEKIGAQPEGVLRSHMQMFNNRRRDSVYYSILASEWELIRKAMFGHIA